MSAKIMLAVLAFSLFYLWQILWPLKKTPLSWKRIQCNLGMALSNNVVLFLFSFLSPIGFALLLGESFGNDDAQSPSVWEMLFHVLILDLAIYFQHRLFHVVPFFWRFHRVHHADPHLDTSTGVRFHLGEIILSNIYKFILIFALGIHWESMALFELYILLNSLFNHSNIQLPSLLEKCLSYVLVTPRFHEIHHSKCLQEAHSNFGFSLNLWDRLFRSYTHTKRRGPLQIGCSEIESPHSDDFLYLLKNPFKKN